MSIEESDCNFTIQNGRAIRWCIDHSDYLITYIYDILKYPAQAYLQYAKKRENLTMTDISSVDTRTALLNKLKLLPERDKLILDRIHHGKKMGVLAKQIGYTEQYTA